MSQIDRVLRELGELQGSLHADAPGVDLSTFERGPEAFATDVARVPALLRWQREYLAAGEHHSFLAVRSCNSAGKTAINLVKAAYECFVRGAVVLYASASWRQNRQQGQRELAKLLLRAPSLKANLYSYGLIPARGRGVIYFLAADDINALQGYHDARVVVILDEFQGQSDDVLEAAFANVSGGDSQIIVTGNPLQYGTPFHAVFQRNAPGWWKRKVDAYEVIDDPAHGAIPGLVTKQAVDNWRWQYGEESNVFGARVRAEFPRTPDDAMFPAEHVAAAFARHKSGELLTRVATRRRVLGIDVGASAEGDESVVAVAKGGHVERLIAWREADTMRSVGRVIDVLHELNVPKRPEIRAHAAVAAFLDGPMPGDPLPYLGHRTTIRVDEIGVGKGVVDRLREQEYACEAFNASKRPAQPSDAERYQNVRAEAYDRFRTLLVKGRVALPEDALLDEELRTCRAFTNSSGRLQVVSKKEWREVLGRSPDRLDAVVMAVSAAQSLSNGQALSEPVDW